MSRTICLGVILSAHGLRGEVKIKCFSDDPSSLTRYPLTSSSGAHRFAIKKLRPAGDHCIATFDNVTDRTQAEKLRGTELYTQRENLPPTDTNEFYIEDLRGLTVKSKQGETLGSIRAVYNFGAGTMVEVEHPKTTEFYPFTNECFPEVNLEKGYAVLIPPDTITATES